MLGPRHHKYRISVDWVGNRGSGTASYSAYSRDHVITAGTKPAILGSSDATFNGDASRWNPEDLFVAAISACHKLWYLHLCADAGIVVTRYQDKATGEMVEDPESGGRFIGVALWPHATLRAGDDVALARDLHHQAHAQCFLANSVNFPVTCEPTVICEAPL